MPALGEILKTAESYRKFTNISQEVQVQLYNMKDSIYENIR